MKSSIAAKARLSDAVPGSCDVLVVGGGSSGCVVAGRLAAESDAHVVLVEAGPDYGPRGSGRWPSELLDGGALVTSHDWGYDSGELTGREPIAFPRARVIGGCSSHNGCVVAVGCPADYDGWAAATGDDRWRAAAIRPALARALRTARGAHLSAMTRWGRSIAPASMRQRRSAFRARTTSTCSTAASASGSSP